MIELITTNGNKAAINANNVDMVIEQEDGSALISVRGERCCVTTSYEDTVVLINSERSKCLTA